MAHIVELADARMIVDEGVSILVHDVRDEVIPDDFIVTLKIPQSCGHSDAGARRGDVRLR